MSVRPLTRTVGVRAQVSGAVDRYGNPVSSFADPVEYAVYAVSPRQSVEEDETGRRPIVTGLTVYAPLGVPVGPHDRVDVDGVTYEVEGEPGKWVYRSPGPSGIQFNLVRSEG